ncbi:MAG: RNA methyltransferase [Ignavibacteriales bacterium]|nr:RNA methyltransferase [Ignavibacteriales bacterium]
MLTNNEMKYYQSLLQKKKRREENKFIVEGKRIIEEGLQSNNNCEIIFLSSAIVGNSQSIYEELLQTKVRLEILKNQDFEKLSETQHPQGIAAVFNKKNIDQKSFGHSELIIALENVSDPGNAGTILRNCDWFGIKEVIIGENCVELYNPKVLRASMGSIFHLEISEVNNLILTLRELKQKGYSILCADMKGKNIFEFQLDKKSIIIFSNEADGPSLEIQNLIDDKITIPRIGKAESLNVASASAVLLAELTKRYH